MGAGVGMPLRASTGGVVLGRLDLKSAVPLSHGRGAHQASVAAGATAYADQPRGVACSRASCLYRGGQAGGSRG